MIIIQLWPQAAFFAGKNVLRKWPKSPTKMNCARLTQLWRQSKSSSFSRDIASDRRPTQAGIFLLLFLFWRPALLLTNPVNFGMNHTHMSGKCIVARESLLLSTQMAAHLLFATVVDSIFMASKIVRARKY